MISILTNANCPVDHYLCLVDTNKYCNSLTSYSRRPTIEVGVGNVPLGGDNPIRVQSMTTVDTMDTMGTVEQSIRMIESGSEYIRVTAPSIKEAKNLENIKREIRQRGYDAPLVADIHFTPNAAEMAARLVEKVRINPGNYADKKKFDSIDYTDSSYQLELDRIRKKFEPLVKICKEYGTAMRIGTNHGSLSDRIMSRFGDTPLGMVESALEFLRICEDMNYHQIVLSMKSSNTRVMVQAYRLLVQKMDEEGLKAYPLHLGVTEAGDGEDGRIKSAVGIGTLLEDGLGDTVRVSLTEEPEYEAPVAKALIDRYTGRQFHHPIPKVASNPIDPFAYHRKESKEVLNIGFENAPRVIADLSQQAKINPKSLNAIGHFYLPEPDKWRMNDLGADYIYSGFRPIDFMLPNGIKEILDFGVWKNLVVRKHRFPLIKADEIDEFLSKYNSVVFVLLDADDFELLNKIQKLDSVVLMVETKNDHAMAAVRRLIFELMDKKIHFPVIIKRNYSNMDDALFQLYAATDIGGLLVDGLGDGVMLSSDRPIKKNNETAFGILQAARTRMTKTEYISCPSCGRTLFDLQETTALIRKRTDHLKGVKIGIMGCIVNGPGEMADADYGYVGSGKGKITLYKGQEVIKRNVPSADAVDELIRIIQADDKWVAPETVRIFN